jgi:S-DNA-T family DNA segregation ATPase FtsK/SpoIIIE
MARKKAAAKKAEPAATPVGGASKPPSAAGLRRRQEVFGVLIILFSILLSFAIYSFSAADLPPALQFNPAAATEPAGKMHNAIGPFGVTIAGVVFYIIGFAAYILPVLLLLWGFYKFRGVMELEFIARTSGGILLLLCLAAIFALPWPGESSMRPLAEAWGRGGSLGVFLGDFLSNNLGLLGAYLTLVMFTVISLILFTDLSVFRVARKGGELVEKGVGKLTRGVTEWRVGRELAREAALEQGTEPVRLVGSEDVPSGFDEPVPGELTPPVTPPPLPGDLLETDLGMMSPGGETPIRLQDHPAETDGLDDGLTTLVRQKPPTTRSEPTTAGTGTAPNLDTPPPMDMLESPSGGQADDSWVKEYARFLTAVLNEYGVRATVINAGPPGPAITRFEVSLGEAEKVAAITGLEEELALKLKVERVRVAVGSGERGTIGIEIPNPVRRPVLLREVLESRELAAINSPLAVALGRKQDGLPVCTDLRAMPHLLIAGTTGSGKSVCINCVIMSMLYRLTMQDVRLILVDHKRVELGVYAGIPHLIDQVVTDPKNAAGALEFAIQEMERRYRLLASHSVRNIESYNQKADQGVVSPPAEGDQMRPLLSRGDRMPYICIVIDELGDLMQLKEARQVEEKLTRLAQMARAVGIHLVIATQRPSVDVVTGVIKANFPSRIAFRVASKVDSRTILDRSGAESLLGKGDMLFMPVGASEPNRIQGCFVSTEEIERTVDYLRQIPFVNDTEGLFAKYAEQATGAVSEGEGTDSDILLEEAAQIVIRYQEASISLLQRKLSIGYARAGRLIDILERRGIVGPSEGSKARKVLVTEYRDEFKPHTD